MKVKRCLSTLVIALVALALFQGALAAKTVPLLSPPPAPAQFIPAWAQPLASLPADENGLHSEGPIEPELLRVLLEAEPEETLRVVISLHDEPDFNAQVYAEKSGAEARTHLVSALQMHAARSQGALRAYLEGARAAGTVDSYTPFWIFNGISVRARPSVIRAIAAQPNVAVVRLDRWRQWVSGSELEALPGGFDSSVNTPQHVLRDRETASAIRNPQSALEWNVARVRADQVWSALQISGTGALVAGMDTGVDWLHPALETNYQGYNPHGPADHIHSWYDATGDGARYPVDGNGHGSHTLGTAVGQGGIGIAPGARWIAVKVLNSQGYGYDSWIHEGFQWLLAPGGDPARTPDVVNCSWGNIVGSLTTFQPDLQALRAAGVLVVFSAGNEGPTEETVESPASLPEAFAVGAVDDDDEVASFSSRGPSPWGEIRPHVAAPGVNVRSSMPGAAYGLEDGTSMAAPHVSGIAALLRSVSPALSITRVAYLITSTALPLGDPIPNNDTGWGRVDAFAATAALAQPGTLAGTVRRADTGEPVSGATIKAVPHGEAGGGRATTGGDGSYSLALAPTIYDVTASAFGYASATVWGVNVAPDATTREDFSLTPLPSGVLQGRISDAVTGQPLTATISVLGTPLEAEGSSYAFALPAGFYTVRASSLGHRVVTATADVAAGEVTVVDLALDAAPSILLVDSGPWYYDSHASQYREALEDLAYAYDEWGIKHLTEDVPQASELAPYDVVVWTAPSDAPGYIGAQDTITGYLSAGGRLMLSGQDIGFLDGGGWRYAPYYQDFLKASLVRDSAETWLLEGAPEDLFAGLHITITGSAGADNQRFPDEIAVVDPDAASPVWFYQGDGCGGLRAGTCLDYRVLYFSFGFEAINDRTSRRQVMSRALDWLVSPRPKFGLEVKPDAQMRIGSPGSEVTHTVRVRHVGQAGGIDDVQLSLEGAQWNSRLSAPSLSLQPCTSDTVVITVTIPSTADWDARDVVTLTARSSLSATLVEAAILTTKAPAPVLLVDDDRWYDQEDAYESALAANGFRYDYWRADEVYGEPAPGSPALDVLQRYPMVVWFTGYDWYEPVTGSEQEALAAYLDEGGRFFLSSQDYLYYHREDPFTRDYLGVVTYTEKITPTLARGVPEDPVGDGLGPYALEFPFTEWADGVVPAPGTSVPMRDQARHAIGVERQGLGHRTLFFSFPFEALPEQGRVDTMERAIGWLSWLGKSTFTADRGAVRAGERLTYTLVLRNDGPETVRASLANTLPLTLSFVAGSLNGPALYNAQSGLVSWEGALEAGKTMTFAYQATVAPGMPADSAIVNTARLGLPEQSIRFRRSAAVRVGAADLSLSTFRCWPSPVRPGALATCALALTNVGPGDAPGATAAISLPLQMSIVPGSLEAAGGGAAEADTGTVRWRGSLAAGGSASLTYQLAVPEDLVEWPAYSVAFLEDRKGSEWERAEWLRVQPVWQYFPLLILGTPAPAEVFRSQ